MADSKAVGGLKWVKGEISASLERVRARLEAFMDGSGRERDLDDAIAALSEVRGVLTALQLSGPARLAEEMQSLSEALADRKVAGVDEAAEALMLALIQLPDYLDKLQAGYADSPVALLPSINDLRASRGAAPRSEAELLVPPSVLMDTEMLSAEIQDAFSRIAAKVRPHFHRCLIQWFHKDTSHEGLVGLGRLFNQLQRYLQEGIFHELFLAAEAVVEALLEGSLQSSSVTKSLIGHLDRIIKPFADDARAWPETEANSLLVEFLTLIARCESSSYLVNELRTSYGLENGFDTAGPHSAMSAMATSPEAMAVLVGETSKELLPVKDQIDLYARGRRDNPAQLLELEPTLLGLANTLTVTGMDELVDRLRACAGKIGSIGRGTVTADDANLLAVAEELLEIESALRDLPSGREGAAAREDARGLLVSTLKEARVEMARAEQLIASLSGEARDLSLLRETPELFYRVAGALRVLAENDAADVLNLIVAQITQGFLAQERIPTQEDLELLARAVSGIDLYMQGLSEGEAFRPDLLSSTREAIEQLASFSVSAITAAVEQESGTLGVSDAEPVSPPPVGDDVADRIDPEFLDIFLEEAEEEEQTVRTQYARWQRDPDDEEALTTLRRSFHTLKGSGRLVGAERIGEFARALEMLLNRVIDGSVPKTPEIVSFVGQAVALLPELIAAEAEGRPLDVEEMTGRADLLASTPTAAAVPETTSVSEAKVIPLPIASHSAVAPAFDSPVAASEEDADAEEAAEAAALAEIDEELLDIFRTEAREHVEVLRSFLDAAAGQTHPSIPDEPVVRSLHTLTGSARMTGIASTAAATAPLERIFLAYQSGGVSATTQDLELLSRAVDALALRLEHLPGLGSEMESLRELAQEAEVRLAQVGAEAGSAQMPGSTAHARLGDGELLSAEFEPTAGGAASAEESEISGSEIEVPETEFAVSETAEIAEAEREPAAPEVTDEDLVAADEPELALAAEEDVEEAPESVLAAPETLEEHLVAVEEPGLELSGEEAAEETQEPELEPSAPDSIEQELAAVEEPELTLSAEEIVEDAQQEYQPATPDVVAQELETAQAPEIELPVDEEVVATPETEFDRVAAEQEPVPVEEPEAVELETAPPWREAEGEGMPTVATPAEESAPALDGVPGIAAQAAGDFVTPPQDPELLALFLEDARDILDKLDQSLRELQLSPKEKGPLEELQRLLHTLKGSARLSGLGVIGDLSHAFESLLTAISHGEARVDDDTLELAQRTLDTLSDQVDAVERGSPVRKARELIQALALTLEEGLARSGGEEPELAVLAPALTPTHAKTVTPARPAEPAPGGRVAEAAAAQIRVRADLLNRLVNDAGEISIYRARLAQTSGVLGFRLGELDQTVGRLRDQLRQLEMETEAQIIHRFERDDRDEGEHREDFDPLELDRFSTIQQLSRSLAETVNDLVSLRTLLGELQGESETLLLQQARIADDLQDGLLRTRMVPFVQSVPRLHRLVRQTAQHVGREARLEVFGPEVELDRGIQERVMAPLEHLLRNAVAHGIEPPREREALGKPRAGVISLILDREGNDVVITVADDGAGLNLDAIRRRAVERGLLADSAEVSEEKLAQLILESGFSTAETVTQVAGRGVGLDVVNTEIKQLSGSFSLDTQPGRGTSFTIRLPLTLAIIEALLVEVGDEVYAIPHATIEAAARAAKADLEACYRGEGGDFDYAGHSYRIMYLGTLLQRPGAPEFGERRYLPLLLARAGDQRLALQVDGMLGSQRIVVKPLGPQLSTIRWISGGTILPDGRVAMIIDTLALIRSAASRALDDAPLRPSAPAKQRRACVMVVDDSLTVRRVTSRMLQRQNMEVLTAQDGIEALTLLEERRPDVVLLDIEMPRMDGYELTRHIRRSDRLKDIPLIMITSRTGEKHRRYAMELGVDRYLGKPYQEADLIDEITSILAEASS